MNKAFEEILDKLKQVPNEYRHEEYNEAVRDVVRFIERYKEKYNNGWIPCSERLPNDFMSVEYLTTVNGHFYPEINYYCVANHKWFSSRKTTKEVDVIAWQPLPEPFKERD